MYVLYEVERTSSSPSTTHLVPKILGGAAPEVERAWSGSLSVFIESGQPFGTISFFRSSSLDLDRKLNMEGFIQLA